jgi:hypothetical protein
MAKGTKGPPVPGYHTGNILCLNYITQPFTPSCIGEPEVILSPLDAALSSPPHLPNPLHTLTHLTHPHPNLLHPYSHLPLAS